MDQINQEQLQDANAEAWYQQIANRVYQLTDTYPVFRLAGHTKWYQVFLNELLVPTEEDTDTFTPESVALRQSLTCSYCERLFNRYGNMVAITENGEPISLVFGAAFDNPESIDPAIVMADAIVRDMVEQHAKSVGISNFVIPTEVYENSLYTMENSEYHIIGAPEPIGGFTHIRLLWSNYRAAEFKREALGMEGRTPIAQRPTLIDDSAITAIANTFTKVFTNPDWQKQLEALQIKFTETYATKFNVIDDNIRTFAAMLNLIWSATKSESNPSTYMVVCHHIASPRFFKTMNGIRSTLFGAVLIDDYLAVKGADLEKCLAKLVEWKSPENYMRGNTQLVKAEEMRKAGTKLEELGYLDSLYRRTATSDEVIEHFSDRLVWKRTFEAPAVQSKNAFDKIADDLEKAPVEAPFNPRTSLKHISYAKFLEVLADKQPERMFLLAQASENWGIWHSTEAEEPKTISRTQRTPVEPVMAVFMQPLETSKTFTMGVELPNLLDEMTNDQRLFGYLKNCVMNRHYVELDCITGAAWNGRIEETGMDLQDTVVYTVRSNLQGIVPADRLESFIEEQTYFISQPISPAALPAEIQTERRAIETFGENNHMALRPGCNWLLADALVNGGIRVFVFKYKDVTLGYAVHFVE